MSNYQFIDVFKKFSVFSSSTEAIKGDVGEGLDSTISRKIFRLAGATPSAASVTIPDPKSGVKSMDLDGKFIYVEMRATKNLKFNVRMDFLLQNSFPPLRFHLSNMYSIAKFIGGNTLQIPFPVEKEGQWIVVALDINALLLEYCFLPAKTRQLCSSMSKVHTFKELSFGGNLEIRGVYTSDICFGIENLPKELNFKIPKDKQWNSIYSFVYFPPSLQSKGKENIFPNLKETVAGVLSTIIEKPKEVKSQIQPEFEVQCRVKRQIGLTEDDKALLKTFPKPILTHSLSFSGLVCPDVKWMRNSPSNSNFFFVSGNLIVKCDSQTGNQTFLEAHSKPITGLDVSKNILVSGGESKIKIWDAFEEFVISSFSIESPEIVCLALSSDSQCLAVVGRDTHAREIIFVFDISNINISPKSLPLIAKQTSEFSISTLSFSPVDSSKLFSCGRENIRFHRIKNGFIPGASVVLNHHARNNLFLCLGFDFGADDPTIAFEADSRKRVLVGSQAGHLFLVNYFSRELEGVYKLHDAAICSISISAGVCVTGSTDQYLRVWPLDFSEFFLEGKHEGSIISLDISVDGLHVVCGISNGGLGILDLQRQAYKTVLRSHMGNVISLNSSSQYIITLGSDETIRVWDITTMEQLYEFTYTKEDKCTSITIHPTSSLFAAGFESGFLRIFDIEKTVVAVEIKIMKAAIHELAYSRNGECLIVVDNAHNYLVLGKDYQPMKSLHSGLKSATHSIAFAPIGGMFAVISDSGTHVAIHDSALMSHLVSFHSPSTFIKKLMFGPDSKSLALILNDSRIRLYLVERGVNQVSVKYVREFGAMHRSNVNDIAFTSDQNWLITVGDDPFIKIWSLTSSKSKLFLSIPSFSREVNSLQLLDDGRLVTAGRDGVCIWKLGNWMRKEMNELDGTDKTPVALKLFDKPNQPAIASAVQVEKHQIKPNLPTLPTFSPLAITYQYLKVRGPKLPFITYKPSPSQIHHKLPFIHSFIDSSLEVGETSQPRTEKLKLNSDFLSLSLISGCNVISNSKNLVWNCPQGWFAYSFGNVVVVEFLNKTRKQKIISFAEPISVLGKTNYGDRLIVGTSSVSSDSEGTAPIYILESETFVVTLILRHHPSGVQDVAVSCDDNSLVSIGNFNESSIAVWSLETGKLRASTYTLEKLNSVVMKPTSKTTSKLEFATVGGDQIHLWTLVNSQLEYSDYFSSKSNNRPLDLTVGAYVTENEQEFFIYGSSTGELGLLEIEGGKVWWQQKVAEDEFTGLTLDSTSFTLVACSLDSYIYASSFYEISKECPFLNRIKTPAPISSMSLDSKLSQGLIGCFDGRIHQISLSVKITNPLVSSPCGVEKMFEIWGEYVMTSHVNGAHKLWSVLNGEELLEFAFPSLATLLHQIDEKRALVFFDNGREVKLINSSSLKAIESYHLNGSNGLTFVSSLSNSQLISSNGGIFNFTLKPNKELEIFQINQLLLDTVNCALNLDDGFTAFGSFNGQVHVYKQSREKVSTLNDSFDFKIPLNEEICSPIQNEDNSVEIQFHCSFPHLIFSLAKDIQFLIIRNYKKKFTVKSIPLNFFPLTISTWTHNLSSRVLVGGEDGKIMILNPDDNSMEEFAFHSSEAIKGIAIIGSRGVVVTEEALGIVRMKENHISAFH